ncbi:hypothetical protein D1007_48868 [Hordeum vulgare]|nr:hypothetical protein D1007_48868 [Hordeum vulgare]
MLARDRALPPPSWLQQHDFPPTQPDCTCPPPRRDGHWRGRCRAHTPPPCRVSAGILGPHPGSLAPFDRVHARQRLGSVVDTVLPRQRARPDSPPPAAEAHPSTPVLSCGTQEVGDMRDSNAPIAAVPSSPSPKDHAVSPLPSTPVSNCHPTAPSDPASILLGSDWMAGSALDAPPGVAPALDAAPVADRAPGGDVHDPVTSPGTASIPSLHGASPATPHQEPCMALVLSPAATPGPSSAPPASFEALPPNQEPATAARDDLAMQPMQMAANDGPLASFVDVISVRASSLLPAPKPRRRRKELPANFTPRRSFRIARADLGLNSEIKAKRVLLRRLGLIEDDDSTIPSDVLDKYALLFEQPLAMDVLQAFADFFGWQLPFALPATARAASTQLIEA